MDDEVKTSSFGVVIPKGQERLWDLDSLHEDYLEARKLCPQKWFDEDWTLSFGWEVEDGEDSEYGMQYRWQQAFSCSIHEYRPDQFTLREYEGRISMMTVGPDDTLKDWPIDDDPFKKVIRVDLKRVPIYKAQSLFPRFEMEGLEIEFAEFPDKKEKA